MEAALIAHLHGDREALEQVGKQTELSSYRPEAFTEVSEKRHGLRLDRSTGFKSYRLCSVHYI